MRRRLPRRLEKKVAEFFGTIGFTDYARLLWDLPSEIGRPEVDTPLAPRVIQQILDQVRHEPAVVAFGATALPNLRRQVRTLEATRGVAAASLLDGLGAQPDALLIASRLDPATVETITSLAGTLRSRGAGSILVILTETGESSSSTRKVAGLADVRMMFWRDRFTGDARAGARHLALLVHVLGAPIVISLRSRLGLETIGWYGRALASFQRLYAVLDVPAGARPAPFSDVYYLRLTAPHATILAASSRDADVLRAHADGLDGLRIAVLEHASAQTLFAEPFEDRRSTAARTAIARLLGSTAAAPIAMPAAAHGTESRVDVTVTIVFHAERELAVPALASLRDMVEAARADGLVVEARAMLDRADATTRRLVEAHGAFLDDIREVSFGDLASVRNAGAEIARGRFLAFVDGDDLWGAEWLSRSHRAAVRCVDAARTIWHPEALLAFWASDCDRTSNIEVPDEGALSDILIQQSSDAAAFEPRDLLFENLWSANCFAARELHLRFPYRPDDWSRQIGIEDWRFNLETLGHGITHLVVPDTVHLIRMKEGGSLGQIHDAKASLPLLD